MSSTLANRTPEFAAGHDSPTSILCLQCPPRILFFLPLCAGHSGNPWGKALKCFAPMGLQEHKEVLKAADERLQSLKVSL